MTQEKIGKSIKRRFIKYAWFLILLPVFTGIVGYVFASKQATVYVAHKEIALGHYESKSTEHFTKQSTANDIMLSSQFLKDAVKKQKMGVTVSWIQAHLSIIKKPENMIALDVTASKANTAKTVVSSVAKAYIHLSNQKYQKKLSIMNSTIQKMKNSKASPQTAYGKQKFLYHIQLKMLDMQKPRVLNPISVTKATGTSPKKRVVLGVVVGVIISLFFLLIPEVLKERI